MGLGLFRFFFRASQTEEEQFVARFMEADPSGRERIVSEFAAELLDRVPSKEAREVILVRMEGALRKEAIRTEIFSKKKREIVCRLMRAFDPGAKP